MQDKTRIRKFKRDKKKKRIRKKVLGTSKRPRLAVYRSAKNIYAQLIDDIENRTMATVSTLSSDLKDKTSKTKSKVEAAKVVGEGIAGKAKELKIKSVVFDRGGYLYHGRVKAVAEGAREGGLEF